MKASTKLLTCFSMLAALSGIAGCAPSPLYISNKSVGTIGEIPRDTRGEPMWATIRQGQPTPPQPAYPTGPALPVTPPQPD